jgi:signal transduction histidine kinase/ligand-binding sensor domain-containing protein
MKRIVKLFLAFLSLGVRSFANDYEVTFFTRHQGLPQDYVYTILQDKKDYLWIGTGTGLTRFDGKSFLHFKQNNGLLDDFITSSCLFPNGTRVFSHFNGNFSACYNGKFFPFITKSPTNSSINTMFLDRKAQLWAGTREGELIVFGKDTSFTKRWVLGEYESIIFIDSAFDNHLLVATNSHLYLMNTNVRQENNMESLSEIPDESGIKHVSSLGNHEWLLLSENNHLFSVKEIKGKLHFTALQLPSQIVPVFARTISKNKFWIMAENGDWLEYKFVDNAPVQISGVKNTSFSPDIVPNMIFEDNEGSVWIGTFGNGLIKLSLKRSNVFLLGPEKGIKVTSALATSSDHLLLGTSAGILEWSDEKKGFVHREGQLAGQSITSICEMEEDHYLVATSNSKLYKWKRKENTWQQWILPLTEQDKVTQVAMDGEKNIWIATSSGAIVYNKKKGKFKLLTMEDGLAHNYVYCVFADSKGKVWLGTHKSGLSYYEDNKIHTLKSPLENSGLDASCFIEDHLGNIWIGTSGQGIFVLGEKEMFIGGISSAEGLVSDYVYFLQKDLSGAIWVGHKNGLSRVLRTNSGYLISDYSQYIANQELTQTSYSINPVNDVWIGGQNVCIRLNVNPENKIPEGSFVDISGLKLNYDEIDWSQKKDVKYHNEIPDDLHFSHNENLLTFAFNGVTFSYNDKLRYQYKLEGFDDNWSLLTEQNFVTYNKLPPGNYTFLVKARNYAGLWSPKPTELHFTIRPPYWETWWFRTLFVISVVAFVYIVIKVRTSNLKSRNEALEIEKIKLEKEVKERKLAESKLLKSELILKNTNQELNTLIYRASHDLRGPVSTISGLVNVANIRVQDAESISFFSMINTSVLKLDQILKKLFLVSEIKQSDLQPELLNVWQCFRTVLDSLALEIEQKQVEVVLEGDQNCFFNMDGKLFETIVKNVVDNTLIYGKKHGSLVKVAFWKEEEMLYLSIWDNGKGIKAEHVEKVFDMFYKASDLSKGNGLGLYIAKKAVVLLGGQIHIKSVENEYTEVNISIPEYKNL